jgi:hypothetical protein
VSWILPKQKALEIIQGSLIAPVSAPIQPWSFSPEIRITMQAWRTPCAAPMAIGIIVWPEFLIEQS